MKGVHLVWLSISIIIAFFLILCVTEGIYVLVQSQVVRSLFYKAFKIALSERVEHYLECSECDSQSPPPLCCVSIQLLEDLTNLEAFVESFDPTLQEGMLTSDYVDGLVAYLTGLESYSDPNLRLPSQCQASSMESPLCSQVDFHNTRAADIKFIVILRLLLNNSKLTKRVSAFCLSDNEGCQYGVSCGVFTLNYPPKVPQVVCSVPVQFMFLDGISRVLGLELPQGASFLLNTAEHVESSQSNRSTN
ncbi:MAG: hypothetical protein N2654_02455 [Deltaproteobacteria bacterium]|nr:hypothetical protein [Deltaproteobacteria bacterium]